MIIRPITTSDISAAVALNNAEIPNVGATDLNHFAGLLGQRGVVWGAENVDGLAGLLVAFEPGTTYTSSNYQWFDERSDDFIYIDRIVVAPTAKGQGIGRAFYERLASEYAGSAREMTCEVNLDPPNESSMVFHRRMGFVQVGTKLDGSKTVSLMAKELG
jgi:predicted GNAT superfamily acetyltransferase